MLKRLRRWRALLGVLVVLAALVGVDAWVAATPLAGYAPKSAEWIAAAADFPAFWQALGATDAAQTFGDALHRPLGRLELTVRQTTGIRPTPLRWRVWLGPQAVFARSSEGQGICVRPGLLLRTMDAFRRWVLRAPGHSGLYTFGPFHYAWRDGCLIASRSGAYVAAALQSPAFPLEPSTGQADLRVRHLSAPAVAVHLHATDGVPISGWVSQACRHRPTPLTLPNVWPEPPMLCVAGSHWSEMRDVLIQMATPILERWSNPARWGSLVHAAAQQWDLDSLPADWDAAVDETAFAILDVDTEQMTPVPEAALILRCAGPVRGPHPLARLADVAEAVPYEWDDVAGRMAPWLGEKLTWCLAGSGRDWLLTTQEPAMALLAGGLQDGGALDADLALRLDWKKAAGCAAILARKAADLELIPRVNGRDFDQEVLPLLRAASELGTLEWSARAQEDWLWFEGYLAHGAHAPKTDARDESRKTPKG